MDTDNTSEEAHRKQDMSVLAQEIIQGVHDDRESMKCRKFFNFSTVQGIVKSIIAIITGIVIVTLAYADYRKEMVLNREHRALSGHPRVIIKIEDLKRVNDAQDATLDLLIQHVKDTEIHMSSDKKRLLAVDTMRPITEDMNAQKSDIRLIKQDVQAIKESIKQIELRK